MQNYRGSSSSLLGQAPLLPKSNGQVTFDVTEDVPELQAHDVDAPERQALYNESEHSMSYFDATHSRDVIKKMAVVVSLPDKYVFGVCVCVPLDRMLLFTSTLIYSTLCLP
jgi:hypothetical protein